MAEKKKKKTAQGFTAKDYTPGLRKKGETFMDFTTRQHEQRYPGAQRMAREAGAGGWRAFTPAGAEYRRGIREEMPWLKQGQRYMSEDWKRMLANRQAGMYGTGAQVGGAPPGRPPLPTTMGNVLGGAPRPIPRAVPLPPGGYPGDPRGRAPQRPRTIGAYPGDPRARRPQISPRGAGTLYDFPPVEYNYSMPPRFSRSYQEDMGTGRAPRNMVPRDLLPPSIQHFPNRNIRQAMPLTTPSVGTGVTDMPPRWPRVPTQVQVPMGSGRAPTGPTQLQQPQRMSYPGQNYGATGAYLGQFPTYPATPAGSRLPYNALGGMPRPPVWSAPGRSQAQRRYMEQPGNRGTAQRMWAERGYPWSPSYRELLGY